MSKKGTSLLVSGCGDLGLKFLKKVTQKTGVAQKLGLENGIVAETKTSKKHPLFAQMRLQAKLAGHEAIQCDHLLIAFPPSESYASDVERALAQWNGKGVCVLLSSTGVYSEDSASLINEDASLKSESVLVEAEKAALDKGAQVLRLGGLYDRHNGPHLYWQKQGLLKTNPEGWINLLHRDDAAEALVKVFLSEHSKRTPARAWNVSDGQPMTRGKIVENWNQTLAESVRIDVPPVRIVDSGLGKKVDPSDFMKHFSWSPRFKDFSHFCEGQINPRNVLGRPLKSCCENPMTGFFRDGYCRTISHDHGSHLTCAEVTEEFLQFSKKAGNDLSTPRPELQFAGLKAGDRWCLCASRWVEALQNQVAPKIFLESTHEQMLEWIELDLLKEFALDLN